MRLLWKGTQKKSKEGWRRKRAQIIHNSKCNNQSVLLTVKMNKINLMEYCKQSTLQIVVQTMKCSIVFKINIRLTNPIEWLTCLIVMTLVPMRMNHLLQVKTLKKTNKILLKIIPTVIIKNIKTLIWTIFSQTLKQKRGRESKKQVLQ